MRTISWFNSDPRSGDWLHKMQLKPGELVQIEGLRGTYRFSIEGSDCMLTPAEPLPIGLYSASSHRHFGRKPKELVQ